MRERSEWSVAAGVGRSLVRRLDAVVGEGRRLVTLLEEGAGFDLGRLRIVSPGSMAGRIAAPPDDGKDC